MEKTLPYPIGNYQFDSKRLRKKVDEYCEDISKRWGSIKNKLDAVKWFKQHMDLSDVDFEQKFAIATQKIPSRIINQKEIKQQHYRVCRLANHESFGECFSELLNDEVELSVRLNEFEQKMCNLWEKSGEEEEFYLDGKCMILYCWLNAPEKYFPYLWEEYAYIWKKYGDTFQGDRLIRLKKYITRNTVIAQGFFYDLHQEVFYSDENNEIVATLLQEKGYDTQNDYTHAITYDFAEYVGGKYY